MYYPKKNEIYQYSTKSNKLSEKINELLSFNIALKKIFVMN